MHRSNTAALFTTLALAGGCSGCADDGAPLPLDSSTGSTTGPFSTSTITVGSTTSSSSGTGGSTTATQCPDWPGWENWDDFAPDCPLCVPASSDALPPPIQWEPCDGKAGFAAGCQQMKVDWPWTTSAFAYTAAVDVGLDGKAVIDFVRLSGVDDHPWRMKVVAEADGKVLGAVVDPRGWGIKGCTFVQNSVTSLRQGRSVFSVVDGDVELTYPEAAVGGPATNLHPPALNVWPKSGGHGFTASSQFWVSYDVGSVGVAKWGQPWQLAATAGEIGLQITGVVAWDDFVAIHASDGYSAGIFGWTEALGPFDLVTFPGDKSQGAFALGTDGVHMVWMQGAGKGSGFLEPYPDRSVMVSPYATDPAGLAPERLRSFPSADYPLTSWIVGCGYAAIAPQDNHVLVVRLSDGWSWEVGAPPNNVGFSFSTVYGLTCDEVFLRMGAGEFNLARVKLDALGPGMPPD